MERACRTWLTVLLCWVTTTLASDGGHRTRSNALGVYGVKSCRGRGGEEEHYYYRAVERDGVAPDGEEDLLCTWSRVVVEVQPPSSLPPPPSPPLLHPHPPPPSSARHPGSQQLPGHLPGSPRPWTTYRTRHRHLRPRPSKEEEEEEPPPPPPLPQTTAADSLRGAASSSGPSHLGHRSSPLWLRPSPYHQPPTPSLRRRRRRSPPVPPKSSYTGAQASPPLSSGAPPPLSSSSQRDNHSQASNAQQQPLFIPVLVPNIPELIPHLRESGLHIPANVSPLSVPAHQRVAPSGQGHGTRPSSDRHPSFHAVDEGVSSQSVRFTPIPPSSETAPPAAPHPIHITINIVPGVAASTPLGSSVLPQRPSAPSAPPHTFNGGPFHPSVSQTYPADGEEMPVQFPAVAGRPTRERYHSSPKPYHIAFLPIRYPSQGAPPISSQPTEGVLLPSHQPSQEAPLPSHQPSHISPSDRPSTPQTSQISLRFGQRDSTAQLPATVSQSDDAIIFPDDSLPSAPTEGSPLPGTTSPFPTTQPADVSRPSQGPQDGELQPPQVNIIFPKDFPSLSLPTSPGQTLTGNELIELLATQGLLNTRIAILVPSKDCPGPCGIRHPDTGKCVVEESCEAALRAEMLV